MVNKAILVGYVGNDPEIREVNNTKVANFNLATSERAWKDKDGNEVPERTEWHRIVVWRGLASIVESYVRKATPLYIEGKIRNRSYKDKDGNTRYTTEIVADVITMLPKSSGNNQDSPGKAPIQPIPEERQNMPPGDPNDDLPF